MRKLIAGLVGAPLLAGALVVGGVAVAVPQIDCLWKKERLFAIEFPVAHQPPEDFALAYLRTLVGNDKEGARDLTAPAFFARETAPGFDSHFCNWIELSDPHADRPGAAAAPAPPENGFTETVLVRVRFGLVQHEEALLPDGDNTLLYSLGRRSSSEPWLIYNVAEEPVS
ncbi:hypothetical protein GCM10022221_48210 [Actinocorallia aurea]